MKNLSKFQLGLLFVFGFFIVVGVILIATQRGGTDGETTSTVTLWGPYSFEVFAEIGTQAGLGDIENIEVNYIQVSTEDFNERFVNEIAEGRAPDLILISQEDILAQKSKLTPIPFDSYPERTYRDSFVDVAEIFISSEGIYAIPVAVDPLVMYWNRTLFANEGVTQAPTFWKDFTDGLTQRLTKRDGQAITQSAVAIGEYSNVRHAKEILGTLLMQAGTPVIATSQGQVASVLNSQFNFSVIPAVAALDFYTQFSSPAKVTYTWDRSKPISDQAFIAGEVAVYFGLASEIFDIQRRNPNLNFDVAVIPQSVTNQERITYGNVYGLAIPAMSDNKLAAFSIARVLSSQSGGQGFSNVLGMPPVRRDLLSVPQTDAFRSVFYNSAIWSRTFLQPENNQFEAVIKRMIESVTGGTATTTGALSRAQSELKALLGDVTY